MKIEVEIDVLEGVLDHDPDARMKLFDLLCSLEREDGEVCGFDEAWIGKCKNTTPCSKHKDARCGNCGKLAVKSCAATIGAFVCGGKTCEDHRCH